MDNDIVQKRLLTRSTVILANTANVDTFAKLSLALLTEGEDGSAAAHRNLIRSLELIELEHSKAKRAKVIATKEVEEYESLGKDIEAKIVETKQDIELLKKELRKEKYVRQRREECEALAKEVNGIEPRDTTSSEIAAVSEELAEKKKLQDATMEEMELRKKQFYLLMQSIQALKPEFSEDSSA